MGLLDSINDHLRKLPEAEQAEVFDFVSFLETKKDRSIRNEVAEWSRLSFEFATASIFEADEDTPYSTADIKEFY